MRGTSALIHHLRRLLLRASPGARSGSLRHLLPRSRPDGIRFGDLRRVTPVSRAFGFERGQPIDRYYIEAFLAHHATDVRGRVLEIGDDSYTRRFGGSRVTRSDVLDLRPDNPRATLVADLAHGGHLPGDAFDCIVFTQTLQFIFEAGAAVSTLHRLLARGGVLLGTFPVVSQICRYDMDRWGDYWRFTEASVRRLLEDAFGPGGATVESHGNVLAAVGFLHGLAAGELERRELDYNDPDYPILVTARAVKRAGGPRGVEPGPLPHSSNTR